MAEHFLDDAQIGAVSQEMRREAVSQKVRINVLFESGAARMFLYDLPDTRCCQFGAALGKKNLAAATALHEFRPLGGQVRRQRFARLATHRHKTGLISLTSHAHNSLFEVEILKTRVCQLRNTQTTCVKQLDHRSIAQAVKGIRVDLFQELLDLQFIQRFREISLDSRERQRFSGIALNLALSDQEPKKNLQRDYDEFDRGSGEPSALAICKIFADRRQGHRARIFDFFPGRTPPPEFAQRPLGGELIIFRKTTLDCEETDKRLDRVFHFRHCSCRRVACKANGYGRHSEGVRDQAATSNSKRSRDIIDKATLSVRCLVTMSLDLNTILKDWPHENGNIKVRKIAGLDGREKLQLRVDLGVLQMEVAGRPDGRRPHNCESLLEYHQKRATRAATKGETYELSPEQCAELQQEGIQYYHRYLSLFQINDFEGVVRDTQRNLDLFTFVSEHTDREEFSWSLQQFRPYVLMMNTRAKASILLGQGKFAEAIGEIERGRDAITDFLQQSNFPELVSKSSEIAFLDEWLEEVKAKRPLSKLEIMQREMETAIAKELYERAAELRDAIKLLQAEKH